MSKFTGPPELGPAHHAVLRAVSRKFEPDDDIWARTRPRLTRATFDTVVLDLVINGLVVAKDKGHLDERRVRFLKRSLKAAGLAGRPPAQAQGRVGQVLAYLDGIGGVGIRERQPYQKGREPVKTPREVTSGPLAPSGVRADLRPTLQYGRRARGVSPNSGGVHVHPLSGL
jgi:hypothetical protein